MSLRLGIILSKNIDPELLENLRTQYNLGLVKINNLFVDNQLMDDEQFFQATKTGYDDLTGIGAFDLYNKNVTHFRQVLEKNCTDKRIVEFQVSEYLERRNGYKNNSLQWIETITAFKNQYRIEKVGLFWHMFQTSFSEERIALIGKEHCNISDITYEYLMKIPEDVLVFFDK